MKFEKALEIIIEWNRTSNNLGLSRDRCIDLANHLAKKGENK